MSFTTFPALIGKNVTVQITPQTRSAAGVLTDAGIGALIFKGRLVDFETGISIETDNISPMDCGFANPVPVEQSGTISLTEIHDSSVGVSTSNGNKLYAAALTSLYHKVVIAWLDNAGAQHNTETWVCVMTGFNPSYKKGMCTGLMQLATIALTTGVAGVYDNNPAYT